MKNGLNFNHEERLRLINILKGNIDDLNELLEEKISHRIVGHIKTEISKVEDLYNKIVLISPTEEIE